MSAPKVRVARLHHHQWLVNCGACPQGVFDFMPWATATTFEAALTLAWWHIKNHQLQTCDHCGRFDPLPKPRTIAGEPSLFRMGDDLYRLGKTVRRVA